MAKPWLAQQLSRLVVNYESEWYDNGSLSKWHELDELVGEEGLPLWQVEKTQRIQKLLWWDQLAGKYGLNSTGKAWFLHPVGVVENFGIGVVEDEMPPWLKIAVREARQWANKLESDIKTNYHKLVGYNSLSLSAEPWCASFVNYCYKESGFEYPKDRPAYSRTYISDKNFLEIKKPCFGSIRVSIRKNREGKVVGGHVTFVYGKINEKEILCLGGNQADQLRLSKYTITGSGAKYFIPKRYIKQYGQDKESLEKLKLYESEQVANETEFSITLLGSNKQS